MPLCPKDFSVFILGTKIFSYITHNCNIILETDTLLNGPYSNFIICLNYILIFFSQCKSQSRTVDCV